MARLALELDPSSVEANAVLAEAYADKYRLKEAEESLEKAMALDASHPEVWRVRGYLLEVQADYAGAAAAYRRAVELAPSQSHLHLSLGHALRAQKSYQEAIKAYLRAAELSPADPRPEGGLGSVYYAMEEYEVAILHFQKAVEIDPNYASGYGQMALAYYVQKKYDRAQPLFEQAVALEKDPLKVAQYRHALGWIHLGAGRYAEARAQFSKALELDPGLQGAKEGLQALEGR